MTVISNEISKAKWFLFNLTLLSFANRKGIQNTSKINSFSLNFFTQV